MDANRLSQIQQRFQLAMDLYSLGEDMLRQKLRRKHPDASPETIEEMVVQWRSERPGAEEGDGVGTPGTWPRTPR